MGATEFGQLVSAARAARGWSLARIAVEVGVLDSGHALNETQVKRILEGRRVLDRDVVQRMIDAFDLDEAEAWSAAELLPPATPLDAIRKLLDTRERSVVAETAKMDERISAGPSFAASQAERRRSRRSRKNPPDIGNVSVYSVRPAQRPALYLIEGEAA